MGKGREKHSNTSVRPSRVRVTVIPNKDIKDASREVADVPDAALLLLLLLLLLVPLFIPGIVVRTAVL